jgi:hypothetical protein
VIDKSLSYMSLLLMVRQLVREIVTVVQTASVYLLFLHSSFVPFVFFFLPSSVSQYLEVFL